MSKIYAHIQMKDGEILGIVFNEEKDSGHKLSSAFGDEVVCTTVEHDESTVITYEIKDGNIEPVTHEDIVNRMNYNDDKSVVVPGS